MARFSTTHLGRQSWPPSWEHDSPNRDRARVLVEHPDPATRELLARGLAQHGYRTVTCAGPRNDSRLRDCPLLVDEPCPAVSGADAVIFGLDRRNPHNLRLFELLSDQHGQHRILPVAHLPAALPADLAHRRHTLYRRVIAPLVRRLYDALSSPHR